MKKENVNHPIHYLKGGIETIDFIDAKKLDFYLGNVVKYVSRWKEKNKKTKITDLKKALWYLTRKIKIEEKNK